MALSQSIVKRHQVVLLAATVVQVMAIVVHKVVTVAHVVTLSL
jgi:hypothetical protein